MTKILQLHHCKGLNLLIEALLGGVAFATSLPTLH